MTSDLEDRLREHAAGFPGPNSDLARRIVAARGQVAGLTEEVVRGQGDDRALGSPVAPVWVETFGEPIPLRERRRSSRWQVLALVAATLGLAGAVVAVGVRRGDTARPGTATGPGAPAASTTPTASTNSVAPGVRACHLTDLSIALGSAGGAAGSSYTPIVFTNRSRDVCSLGGYPRVFYATGPDGGQVGPAPSREARRHHAIDLGPGASAYALLIEGNAANYPVPRCTPVATGGLRVAVPHGAATAYLPWPHIICSRAVQQSHLRPIQPGSAPR